MPSKVYIEGQLETRKWQDQSGADRYSTEVVLRPFRSELTILDNKGAGAAPAPSTAPAPGQIDDKVPFREHQAASVCAQLGA